MSDVRPVLAITTIKVLWATLGAYTIFAVVFQTITAGGPLVPVIALGLSLLSVNILWWQRHPLAEVTARIGARMESVSPRQWIAACLGLGIILRLAWSTAFPFYPYDDMARYWTLAHKLAAGQPYEVDGTQSFWPPGIPLVLSPLVAVFGPVRWLPPAFNIVLFVGTALVAWRLAVRLADARAGRLAMLIVAVSPNLVFMSNSVHKELLVAFLLPAGYLLYDAAAGASARTRVRAGAKLVFCGICLGIAALSQPATTLLGVVFVGYEFVLRAPVLHAVGRLAAVGLVTVLTIAPWTVRNYVVHGAFVPINTAGGTVFLSVNNESATGGWISRRHFEDDVLRRSGEVERDRLSYQKAFRWIAEHKAGFNQEIVKGSRKDRRG
jgi:hypothetical protein